MYFWLKFNAPSSQRRKEDIKYNESLLYTIYLIVNHIAIKKSMNPDELFFMQLSESHQLLRDILHADEPYFFNLYKTGTRGFASYELPQPTVKQAKSGRSSA